MGIISQGFLTRVLFSSRVMGMGSYWPGIFFLEN